MTQKEICRKGETRPEQRGEKSKRKVKLKNPCCAMDKKENGHNKQVL